MRLFKYQVDRIARDGSLVRLGRNVLLPGVGSCFTCTCKAVRHVHVGQHDMCISCCFTCTSKTMLPTEASYVTLRDRALSIPEKETDGNDKRH